MGLDQYLDRMPRYKDCTPNDVSAIEAYLDWKTSESAQKYTLKEWCGVSEDDLPSQEAFEFYGQFWTTTYPSWDTEHKYPRNTIHESVGYWRKANAIHKWFVDNVQDGVDNCNSYEVSKGQLEQLLRICMDVKGMTQMEKGYVKNGETYANGMWCPMLEEGEYIINPEVAEELLPTQGGFFFGSTDYDQWYMQDIDNTIEILEKVLEETDFNTQMISYASSW